MKHYLMFFAIMIMILLQLVLAPMVLSQTRVNSVQPTANLNGTWRGTWTNPQGYVYFAEMHLNVSADGVIDGDIRWTLNNSPQDADIVKIGFKATEYIKGSYDAQNRILTFEGYKKDDPDIIIGLDKYKLIFSEDNKVIGGITFNNGNWRGLFSLIRVTK